MNILTEDDFVGVVQDHPWAKVFLILAHSDGSFASIPKGFFCDWLGNEPGFGTYRTGKCSGFGLGSTAKYDSDAQKLTVGRYVAGGHRLRFVLNGQHETQAISMAMFSSSRGDIKNLPPPQYGDMVLKNDIWIGDEAMILGGATIENGCIIGARALVPPNFKSEPYGVYVGSPAKLVKFRFSEKIREGLVELAWWDLPLEWVKENNDAFLVRLSEDEGKALEILAELKEKKAAYLAKHKKVA